MLRTRLVMCSCLATLLAPSACGGLRSDSAQAVESIEDRYSEAAPGQALALRDVTSFSWDTFHVFDPYTSQREMNGGLGFRWDGSRDLPTDRFDLLVWVHEDEVVESALLPRGDVSFPALGDGVTRGEAVFTSATVDRGSVETVVLSLVA